MVQLSPVSSSIAVGFVTSQAFSQGQSLLQGLLFREELELDELLVELDEEEDDEPQLDDELELEELLLEDVLLELLDEVLLLDDEEEDDGGGLDEEDELDDMLNCLDAISQVLDSTEQLLQIADAQCQLFSKRFFT
ncbi:MAG: hypothetical protein QM775_09565 [Pirellulales bacterium]